MAKKTKAKAKNDNKTAKGKAKGPRQQEIPGTERPKIPALEEAFENYDEANQNAIAAKNVKDSTYDSVIERMRDAGVKSYSFPMSDGTTVTVSLSDKTKLKVHKKKPEAFKDAGDED